MRDTLGTTGTWFFILVWISLVVYAGARMIRQRRVSEREVGFIAGGVGAALIVCDDIFHLTGQTSTVVIWVAFFFLFICVVAVDRVGGKVRGMLASYARRRQPARSMEHPPNDASLYVEPVDLPTNRQRIWTIDKKRGPPGELREWYWSARVIGGDYQFHAKFAPSDKTRLATLLREHSPKGFRFWCTGENGALDETPGSCDFYFNEQSYDDLIAAQERRLNRNLFRYTKISVCGSELKIDAGFGGAGSPFAETTMLMLLAQSPELALLEWAVKYGGDMYPVETAAIGRTGAELVAYLTDPTAAPEPDEIVLDMFTLSEE